MYTLKHIRKKYKENLYQVSNQRFAVVQHYVPIQVGMRVKKQQFVNIIILFFSNK